MRILFATLLVGLWFIPTVAAADCFFKGNKYPEGTRLGVLVCVNNAWIARP